jgi:iron complex outermembrane receptor protein
MKYTQKKNKAVLTSYALVTCLAISTTPAAAQQLALEEVVVIATKKAQSIQDVPLAVSAVPGNVLESAGFFEVAEIGKISPSVSINTSGNLTQSIVRIRGIGSGGTNPGFESAVGVVIDNVIRSRAGQALSDFVDIERVEVLRGPQGTLFGKNTTAGVIHLISNAPEFQQGGNFSASYGSYDQVRMKGAITGPLSDTVAYRIAASSNQRDGYIDRLAVDPAPIVEEEDYYNNRDRFSVKGQLLFAPRDDLSIRVIADYSELDEIGSAPLFEQVGATTMGINAATRNYIPNSFDLDSRQTRSTIDPTEVVESTGLSVQAEWNLEIGTLTSISAYREYNADIQFDLDSSGADYIGDITETSEIKLLSQEIRLAGTSGKLDWLVGGFFAQEDIKTTSNIAIGSAFGAIAGIEPAFVPLGTLSDQGIRGRTLQDQTSLSLFSHNTYNFTDKFAMTAGLRFSDSEKEGGAILNDASPGEFNNDFVCVFVANVFTALCNNYSTDIERSESEFAGSIIGSYVLNDNMNTYASFSRGYKGGGFNLDREALSDSSGVLLDLTEFDAEFVDSYEIGLKARIWDDRATVNIALFYADYTDYQFQQFDGVSFTVINVPDIVSQGVEVETTWQLADGVRLDVNATYNESRFDDDLDDGTVSFLDPYEGQTLPSAPKLQGGISLNVIRPLGSTAYNYTMNASYYYRGAQNTSASLLDATEEGSHGLLNASFGIRTNDDVYGVTFSGSNLTDEFFGTFKTPGIAQPGSVIAHTNLPRTYAITFDAQF